MRGAPAKSAPSPEHMTKAEGLQNRAARPIVTARSLTPDPKSP